MSQIQELRDWIKDAVVSHFSPRYNSNPIRDALKSAQEVEKFITESESQLLCITFDEEKSLCHISTDAKDASLENSCVHVILVKVKQVQLTRENISESVEVIAPFVKSPAESLYKSIHGAFLPLLSKNANWTVKTKLQSLLAELDYGLSEAYKAEDKENQFQEVFSIENEHSFWKKQSESTENSKAEKLRGKLFTQYLQAIKSGIEKLKMQPFDNAIDTLGQVQDSLDDLWKETEVEPYPQSRMVTLLALISNQLVLHIQEKLSAEKICLSSTKNTDYLSSAILLCKQWDLIVSELITKYWPYYEPHKWSTNIKIIPYFENGLFTYMPFKDMMGQLSQLTDVRIAIGLYLQLLDINEQKSSKINNLIISFESIDALAFDSVMSKNWKFALAQFAHECEQIEPDVINCLRTIFYEYKSHPVQLLHELTKYQQLLNKFSILKSLAPELDNLFRELQELLVKTRHEVSSKLEERDDRNSSNYVVSLVWAKHQKSKLEEIRNLVNIKDINQISALPHEFSAQSLELDHELDNLQKVFLDEWISLYHSHGRVQTIDMFGNLIDFDYNDGKVYVNFSDQLVCLLHDVRQLLSIGYAVPASILKIADQAAALYHFGVVLKQIAYFYNTIEHQMLPSQQPMLLDAALSFESLIKNPVKDKISTERIVWDNPNSVKQYISRLQLSADEFMNANRKLRGLHSQAVEYVSHLFDLDLNQEKSAWKDQISSIRNVLAFANNISVVKHVEAFTWKAHWDIQLYKVLEYQYSVGLDRLSDSLPEMKVDIVYKQQQLQFRPPFEEIKAKYYRELKKFINIPAIFCGILNGDTDQMAINFATVLDSNTEYLSTVYMKAETLFQNLYKTLDLFRDWVGFSTIELNDFLQEGFTETSDWEANFKVVKQKGKDAEQLPQLIRLDCLQISTASVKASIDDQLQHLFDTMVYCLQSSIDTTIVVVEQFIATGLSALSNRKPQTLTEIRELKVKHEELSAKKEEVAEMLLSAEARNRLLKAIANSGKDFTSVSARWSKLEMILESHEMLVKEQIEGLQSAIQERKQQFVVSVGKTHQRWIELKPKPQKLLLLADKEDDYRDVTVTINEAVKIIEQSKIEIDELSDTSTKLHEECIHIGTDDLDISVLVDLKRDIVYASDTWQLCKKFLQEIQQFKREDWITFRTRIHTFDEILQTWNVTIVEVTQDTSANDKGIVSVWIKKEIDKYIASSKVWTHLRGENWMPEHWGELFRISQVTKIVPISELTFGDILTLSAHLVDKLDIVKELNRRVNVESTIRDAINELEMWGATAIFALTKYDSVKGKSVVIVKDWKDVLTSVSDSYSLLLSIKDSPYYSNFADKGLYWERKLTDLDECLQFFKKTQRKWMYLEPIFSRGSLPTEQARFMKIDEEFRHILTHIEKDNRICSILNYPSIKQSLFSNCDQLERCQKALNDYLEDKRSSFARFYFIGDEDLLEILGQAKNPEIVQTHLKKLYAGVHNVVFDSQMRFISGMKSSENELVELKNTVEISENIEYWLELFTFEMEKTLKLLLSQCLQNFSVVRYPAQILSLVEWIMFTKNCEIAIKSGNVSKLLTTMLNKLSEYTSFNYNQFDSKAERNIIMLRVKGLIMDIIHFIDVIKQLQNTHIENADGWEWQKQLRFYCTTDESIGCFAKMSTAQLLYTFEYQGNIQKLVHTQLTDKCFLTLSQAISNGFGGNPFGPAGTGKTESVKALGSLLGRQVLVFNCDEGIDYKSMGRILTGIVKSGAWGCFDEFNRLEEAVLSAVSQQIQSIQSALKLKSEITILLGKSILLNPNSGVFVTLNPAGKNYGGRQKLPDNLKQLFRSVAMTYPDNEQICEVILYSEGFTQGLLLAKKIVSVFNLCKNLLSRQQHYDWGLRPIKAVLTLSGNLMHGARVSGPISEQEETLLVIQALRMSILPKLTYDDNHRFNNLMEDIFLDNKKSDLVNETFYSTMKDIYTNCNLIYNVAQAEKVYQFYEACKQRMGVVIVGQSGCGKSTISKIAKCVCEKLGQKIKYITINPKSLSRNVLLGQMDVDTREWSDGIVTVAARNAVKEPQDITTWIYFDGDIDPEWIESFNSVLDDNHLLTMPTGERIQFGNNVNFIFETDNLKFASPATISRMGMIYISEELLDIKDILNSWILTLPSTKHPQIMLWTEEILLKCLSWIMQSGEQIIPTSKIGIVLAVLSHLGRAMSKAEYLVLAMRAVSANLNAESRAKLAGFLDKMTGDLKIDIKKIFDYHINEDKSLQLYSSIECNSICEENMKTVDSSDSLPVVETPDVLRLIDILQPWLEDRVPIILSGPPGVGKKMILLHCTKKLKSTSLTTIFCSAQTRPVHLLQRLYQLCMVINSQSGNILRPKDTEYLILFLKDIDLPKPDKYATVELLQFIQQLITYKGFYSSTLEWIGIERIQIVATIQHSHYKAQKLSIRFMSNFCQCYVPYSDHEQVLKVYRSIGYPLLNFNIPDHCVWSITNNVQKLSATMVNIFFSIKDSFTPDQSPHYIFSVRDLSEWMCSILCYECIGNEPNELLEILYFESNRIFKDRLVGDASQSQFEKIFQQFFQNEWGFQPHKGSSFFTTLTLNNSTANNQSKRKLQKLSAADYLSILQKEINLFEREGQELDFCFFPEILELVASIERALLKPRGSILLAGRPGVGRSNAVMLVSFYLKMPVFSPILRKNYSIKLFLGDLKQAITIAAIQEQASIFLVEEFHFVKNKEILEIVNCLLSGFDVPGLYEKDEYEIILASLKEDYSKVGYDGTLHEFYISRIKRNLHIILLMDCANPDLFLYCESNPALYSRCSFKWTDNWSKQSMSMVAKKKLESDEQMKLSDLNQTIHNLVGIHNSSRIPSTSEPILFSPRNYIHFIDIYIANFNYKTSQLTNRCTFLSNGLQKLQDAVQYIDKLKKDAAIKQKDLDQKQKEADSALKQITSSMVQAESQRSEIERLSILLKEEELKVETSKISIEKELSEVDPIVQAAKAAVGDIKSESLTEIRSLRAPPPAIRDVLEGVLRLMGVLDMSWNSMKGFLGKRTVKDEIMNFEVRNVSSQIRESVEQLIKEKKESFDEANIRRASIAAAPLAMWVKAVLRYSSVLSSIGPMEQELIRLKKVLDTSKDKMKVLEQEISVVDAKVSKLKENFTVKTGEAESLKSEVALASTTIKSAEDLLEKLSGEKTRWTSQMHIIKDEITLLPKNLIFSNAAVAYLGEFSEGVRESISNSWMKLCSINVDRIKLLCSESEQLVWKMEGLPSDNLSFENAAITLNSKLTPLLIDPTGQAVVWLENHYKDNKPEIVNYQDENLMKAIELAVRFGKLLIIKDVLEIDPIYIPILRKDLVKVGARYTVKLGDKIIDYHNSFQLILATKSKTFSVPVYAHGLLTEVNFSVTRTGLADQLLSLTVLHEKPELESEKILLIKSEEKLKVQLTGLEDALLKELANATGNILENHTLLSSLNETKEKANTISESLKNSLQIQANLNNEREIYKPFSIFASNLYFILGDLQKLKNMYQFSLDYYLSLFRNVLDSENSSGCENRELRLEFLLSALKNSVFYSISRSLFKEDHLIFALYLVYRLYPNLIDGKEWSLFVGESMSSEVNLEKCPEWVPAAQRQSYVILQNNLPEFSTNLSSCSFEALKTWVKKPKCEHDFNILSIQISAFQKVLLVQALRPDRIISTLSSFCCTALGIQTLSSEITKLGNIYKNESVPTQPILFITSPGVDISQELIDFAAKEIGSDKFCQIAMGQGQGDHATEMLKECMRLGKWLYLQNVHLAIKWISILEQYLMATVSQSQNGSTSNNIHPNFRLWLSTEAHSGFSQSFLESALKIAVEPPPGIKKNLFRTIEGWGADYLRNQSALSSHALFALSWFHAILQERRAYIPIGWSKFYEFSQADLRSTADLIISLSAHNNIPDWDTICGLIENAIYGGRVDAIEDIKKLRAFLQICFNKEILQNKSKKLLNFISLPNKPDFNSYLHTIDSLQEADNPSVFCLPANIEQTQQISQIEKIVPQLRDLCLSNVGQKQFNREYWRKELAPLLQYWKKINTGKDIVQKRIVQTLHSDPIGNFIELELANAVVIIKMIHGDFSLIAKIIRGNILLTQEFYHIGQCLVQRQVPQRWSNLWEGPLNVFTYIDQLFVKYLAIEKWREGLLNQKSDWFKSPRRLADLYNPAAFLNALCQKLAREEKVGLDSLFLVSSWNQKELENGSIPPLPISGLFVQGALFDGEQLVELSSEDPSFSTVPTLFVKWMSKKFNLLEAMDVPLYTDRSRETIICYLKVPNSGGESKWVLNGLSFFVSS
ncbi:dynein heavy chain and region D6 of dynein motor-domain-containing protein [Cladochytrium replicatum]|nr:dynein heavy chain and region D6 of dynein motor-domain-containing protein [Cladochytrium replicatum]